MRILTFDELTPELERSRAFVNLAAFGSLFTRERIRDLRRSKRIAEYVGVFAVQGNRVLGHVFVELIPYRFPDGEESVSGIATVGTRPDASRSGVAEALLRDAHLRERQEGRRYASLWTNRSWGAHHLYEKLGYRDVYSSPWAIHVGPAPPARTATVRAARRGELAEIERLHERVTRGRIGYCQRPPGFLRSAVRFHYVDPISEILVCHRGGELVGYAHLERSRRRIICGELVAAARPVRAELIRGVGQLADGIPYAFQHTPVTDNPELFREPAFVGGPSSWYGMMGANLEGVWTGSDAVRRFGTRDPRFVCLSGDRF